MAKRIFLFLLVNFLVVTTISILLSVFHVQPYLTAYGLDYRQLAFFCLLWGMTGSLISLMMSRAIAKWSYGVQLVPPETSDPTLRSLVDIVHDLSRRAQLPTMPEVGIYNSAELNAFATGPSKSRALVAVSTGLLQRMRTDEMRGALGHEISHVANGDMVTMALLQGIMNAFVMFLSRVIAYAVTIGRDRQSSLGSLAYFLVRFVLEIVLMFLGSIVIAWFSRLREYRADAGGAKLASKEEMIGALEVLRRTLDDVDTSQPALATMKISSKPSGIWKLWSTHPPLEERIARLQSGT